MPRAATPIQIQMRLKRKIVARTTAPARRASFGKTPSPATHKGVITESRYLLMSDGCRIAADIMRPKSATEDEQLPTVVIIARYWRSFALRGIAPPNRAPIGPRDRLPDFLLARGYAVVVVDSRG